MKPLLTGFGILLALAGFVWFLQGAGIFVQVQSFMNNNSTWVVIGLLTMIIGIGLVVYSRRRPARVA